MRNFLYLFALVFLFSCSENKESFTIKGEISGLDSDLYYADIFNSQPRYLDTIKVTDGKFDYKSDLTEDDNFRFLLPASDPTQFIKLYVDNSDLTISANIDSLEKAEVKGSVQQSLYDKLMSDYDQIHKKSEDLAVDVQLALMTADAENAAILEDEFYANEALKTRLFIDFAKANSDKTISAWALYQILMYSDFNTLDSVYNKFSDEVKSSAFGKDLKIVLDEMGKVAIGAEAPDFTLADLNNRELSISSYKGKNVLLLFWSPMCVYCKEEIPLLNELYEKYKSENIEFVGVNVDEEKNFDIWQLTVENENILYPQVFDSIGIADMYKISNTPFNFFIDKNGKIFSKDIHGDDIEKEIIRILNTSK